jgi:uncharacterized protein (TIGR00730 family)
MMKKWVCVFCASAEGASPEYLRQARLLGRRIAERGYGLVYGGATVGTMGAVADAALAAAGEVMGVIPDLLMARELGHQGLTELHVVGTMHERKALLAERADAFVALPGGFGTLDEFLEILTWAQLRIHSKPCVLVNVNGYYDGLLAFFDTAVEQGFLKAGNRALVQVAGDVEQALAEVEQTWAARAEAPTRDARLDELVQ